MGIEFIKMTTLGNDYICIDLMRNNKLNIEELIEKVPEMCKRNFGIGSDGVIFMSKDDNGFWMRMFNPDGSEAGICGNGLRCIARIIFDRKYSKENTFDIYLRGAERNVKAVVDKDDVTIAMGKATVGKPETIEFEGRSISFIPVDIGNPHAVVFVNDISLISIDMVGSFIENHKYFPHRANVEFVNVAGRDKLSLRVWERGVGETMACGSGACASLCAAFKEGYCNESVEVEMPGGSATVSIDDNNCTYLTGPVTYVFKGEYLVLRS